MYDQIREDIFFFMFYASVAMLSLIACCYLLFRRANAIVPDVTPPVRLRRWTAAFFAATALCHLWYLPTYFPTSSDDMMLSYLIAVLLDCITVIPLTIVVLLVMLQDRRRPLWPVAVMVAPLVLGMAWRIVTRSDTLQPVLFAYFLLMWLGLIIYMVRAIRQYGRWLRDNYADLEHKEVWQGFVVLAIFFLVYAHIADETTLTTNLVQALSHIMVIAEEEHTNASVKQVFLHSSISLLLVVLLSRMSLIISSAERLSFQAPTKRFAHSASVFVFFAGTNDFTKANILVIAGSLSRSGLISRNNSARNSIAVIIVIFLFLGAKIRKVEHKTKKLVPFFVETEYLLASRSCS